MKSLYLPILLLAMSTNTFADTKSVETNKQKTIEMRTMLIGKWCGNKHLLNGDYQIWTANRFDDGTYEINFTLTEKNGTKSTWGEYGIWGVRYPVYFTAVRGFIDKGEKFTADTNSPELYDAFTIKSLTKEHFTYQSFTSENIFTVSKNCN